MEEMFVLRILWDVKLYEIGVGIFEVRWMVIGCVFNKEYVYLVN